MGPGAPPPLIGSIKILGTQPASFCVAGPATSNSIPSDLSVTVNGVSVPVRAFVGNAYNAAYPPFPLESVAYTIPPGTNGTTVSVAVSTGSGTTTLSNALTYLPASQQFSLTGSALAQGIYDPHTGLYYFTDTTQIQVFSRAQGKWLTPIPIAPPAGTSERLWGIALSPNGTLMAIADASAGVIYLLNPASPTPVKTFSLVVQAAAYFRHQFPPRSVPLACVAARACVSTVAPAFRGNSTPAMSSTVAGKGGGWRFTSPTKEIGI